jgi:mRNA-degrading endonuclease RelE of RelBE toxin-antitoxin system
MKTKKILLTVCLLCSGIVYAQNSTIDKLFDKYENEDDIIFISISKAMLQMIPGNINTGDVNINEILPKIETMRLISSYKTELKEKMEAEIKTLISHNKNYEEMMRVKDGKSNVIFNIKKKENMINELIMTINSENSFVFIFITGSFTFEDVQKIAEKTQ